MTADDTVAISDPHFIDITMSDDRIRVYALNFGIRFSDLTDDEKETAYFSQRHLAEKYEKEASQLRGELAKARPHRVRVLVRKIRKSK